MNLRGIVTVETSHKTPHTVPQSTAPDFNFQIRLFSVALFPAFNARLCDF
jgi:hypothetical protein